MSLLRVGVVSLEGVFVDVFLAGLLLTDHALVVVVVLLGVEVLLVLHHDRQSGGTLYALLFERLVHVDVLHGEVFVHMRQTFIRNLLLGVIEDLLYVLTEVLGLLLLVQVAFAFDAVV